MNANELMIGNYVYDRIGLETRLRVLKIEDGIITCGDALFSYPYLAEDIIPIPLSPEILDKCGFERIREGKDVFGNHIVTCKFNSLSIFFRNGVIESSNGTPALRHIKHLHSLQNIASLLNHPLNIEL